jgi:hypothetical protein
MTDAPTPNDAANPSLEGSGESSGNGRANLDELRLIRSALRRRFAVDRETRALLAAKKKAILKDPLAPHRSIIAVGRLEVAEAQADLAAINTAVNVYRATELAREVERTRDELAEMRTTPWRPAPDLESISTVLERALELDRDGDGWEGDDVSP